MEYLTDFSRRLENIGWIYLNIREISVDSGQRVKKLEKLLKTAIFRPNRTPGYEGYLPDISQGLLYTGYHEFSPLGWYLEKLFCLTKVL